MKKYVYKKVKSFDNGGVYSEHVNIDRSKSDYKLVRHVGIEFARMGKDAKAVPQLHFKSDEYNAVYGALKGTMYDRKCPDLLVSEKFYEVEGYIRPFKKDKINRMLWHGLKQSNNIVIDNTKGCSDRYIKKLIYDRIKINQKINEVWLYEKGKIRLLYKKQ